MKRLLISTTVCFAFFTVFSQTGGALLPSQPYEVPEYRTPTVPVPERITFDDISLEEKERRAWNEFKKKVDALNDASSYDSQTYEDPSPSKGITTVTEPKRWDPPLSAKELNTIMNCANYERFGLTPEMTKMDIVRLHSKCCFGDGDEANASPRILYFALAVAALAVAAFVFGKYGRGKATSV